jgi:hypothetical protein
VSAKNRTQLIILSSIMCLLFVAATPCKQWSWIQYLLLAWPIVSLIGLFTLGNPSADSSCKIMGASLFITLADLALLMMYVSRSCWH